MDKLSEKFHNASTYAYVMNNPVMMFDPDGRDMQMPDWLQGLWNNTNNESYWSSNGSGGFTGGEVKGGGMTHDNFTSFYNFLSSGQTGNYTYFTGTSSMSSSYNSSQGSYSGTMDLGIGHNITIKGNQDNNSFNNLLSGLGNMTNAGEVVWGGAETAANYKGSGLASAMGIEARQIAMQMPKFLGVAGKVGKTLGVVGYVASGFSLGTKLVNGEKVSTSEYVSFGINTAFVGAGIILAGTAAAPFIATGALIYGVAELGTYVVTGGSIEDQIFGN